MRTQHANQCAQPLARSIQTIICASSEHSPVVHIVGCIQTPFSPALRSQLPTAESQARLVSRTNTSVRSDARRTPGYAANAAVQAAGNAAAERARISPSLQPGRMRLREMHTIASPWHTRVAAQHGPHIHIGSVPRYFAQNPCAKAAKLLAVRAYSASACAWCKACPTSRVPFQPLTPE